MPSGGLFEGQTITITSSGLLSVANSAGVFVPTAWECAAQFPSSAVFDFDTAINVVGPLIGQNCVKIGDFPLTQSDVTSRRTDVFRSFTTVNGGLVQCGLAPGDCVILASGFVPGAVGLASAPLTFAPPTPRSEAECRQDGWRHLANAKGRPFKNQGRCISFVRHHHR